jgi:glucose/arabinose dehydrogenase
MKPVQKALSIFSLVASLSVAPLTLHSGEIAVKFTPVYQNLTLPKPISLVIPPDGTNRQFLVLQGGRILILPEDPAADKAEVFLDLSDRNLIEKDFEEGLLGLAFHPKFKENGRFYIYHSQQNPKRSQIVEMKVSATDPSKADLTSERLLLEVPQPFWNHNSGNMLFGPDGYLYIALGDGGKGNDPLQLAQNRFILNGSILRLDVDTRAGDLAYGIPADNPFVGQEGMRPEIWSYGMRNPWGLHFDEAGTLWCADVGQDLWEEIDHIVKGGNYGWSFREGTHAFGLNQHPVPEDAKFIDPIHEYTRTDGTSITGGVVYRGEKIPALKGAYVYGDWGYSNIWALKVTDGKKTENAVLFHDPSKYGDPKAYKPTAFCEGPDQEILLLSWTGRIYRIDPAE